MDAKDKLITAGVLAGVILFIGLLGGLLLGVWDVSCPTVDNDDAYTYVMNKYPSAEVMQYREQGPHIGVKFLVDGTTKKVYLEGCGDVLEYESWWVFEQWGYKVVDNWHIVNSGRSQRFEDKDW